jgi:hypothetical protein
MPLATVDDILARCAAGFELRENFAVDQRIANTGLLPNFAQSIQYRYTVPTMPSGVSAFIPSEIDLASSTLNGYFTVAKAINLGSLNISTNVFTDGSSMPTVTELGVSRVVAGGMIAVVEVALNATPGSLSVTYVDQDGNAAEASPVTAMTASSTVESGGVVPLNSPDWGVRDVTTAARTGGTTPTGTVRFYGLIPIGCIQGNGSSNQSAVSIAPLGLDFNPIRLAAGDLVIVMQAQLTAARAIVGSLQFIGDTP